MWSKSALAAGFVPCNSTRLRHAQATSVAILALLTMGLVNVAPAEALFAT